MAYWLFKSEPDEYSIDDLAAEASGFGVWDGIRNYQARNLLRDKVAVGDKVFFYHSSCKLVGVAGIMEVVKAAYPDPAQFDSNNKYFDAKASEDKPRWFCVDVRFEQKFAEIVALKMIKATDSLKDMVLVNQGRLSIQPVSKKEWQTILKLAKA
jgi:predicted RNA-binding protein with PUA-like domain